MSTRQSRPEVLESVVHIGPVQQDGRGADPLRQVEDLVQSRLAKIGVDKHDPLAALGQREGEIGGDGRLAVVRVGEVIDAANAVRSTPRKAKLVRSFRNASAAAVRGCSSNRDGLLDRLERRDRADHREPGRRLQLLRAPDRAIQEVAQEGQPDAEHQAEEEAKDEVQPGPRSDGSGGREGGLDQADPQAEPLCSSGTASMKARATLLVSRFARAGIGILDLQIDQQRVGDGLGMDLCLQLARGSGWGSRRRAVSAVARDSRIWANDLTSCWESSVPS